jgi:hypothetical protein
MTLSFWLRWSRNETLVKRAELKQCYKIDTLTLFRRTLPYTNVFYNKNLKWKNTVLCTYFRFRLRRQKWEPESERRLKMFFKKKKKKRVQPFFVDVDGSNFCRKIRFPRLEGTFSFKDWKRGQNWKLISALLMTSARVFFNPSEFLG